MRAQVTLYNGSADRLAEIRDDIEEQRDGDRPTRAETIRLLMDQFDPEDI